MQNVLVWNRPIQHLPECVCALFGVGGSHLCWCYTNVDTNLKPI